MSLRQAASAAAASSVLVRVSGPDADGRARASAAFHGFSAETGEATLSCSGVLLQGLQPGRVLAPAALLQAFAPGWPSLEPHVRVEVLLGSVTTWRTAVVAATVDLLEEAPELSDALRPLAPFFAQSELWLMLLHVEDAHASLEGRRPAVWASASSLRRGDALCAAGAPFGALARSLHASASHAHVSHTLPPQADPPAALLLDMRCLAGLEGAPLCGPSGAIVAMLLPPLRGARGGSAELALGVSADTLVRVLERRGYMLTLSSSPCVMPESALDRASRAVALLAIHGGSRWGSCVAVGSRGRLYLTAAHVLHPQAARLGLRTASAASAPSPGCLPALPEGACAHSLVHTSDGVARTARTLWLSRGPLDVALIQLESDVDGGADEDAMPRELCELRPCAATSAALQPGSHAAVLGHAHMGPAACLPPGVTWGVVAAHTPSAAMLRVSAEIHAGASGGAVVCPHSAALLGLVTSNASLALGGVGQKAAPTTLPTLNFSVSGPRLGALCDAARGVEASDRLAPGQRAPGDLLNACRQLDQPDELLSRAWALQDEPESLPGAGPSLARFLRSRV